MSGIEVEAQSLGDFSYEYSRSWTRQSPEGLVVKVRSLGGFGYEAAFCKINTVSQIAVFSF